MIMTYDKSVELALSLGYKKVLDKNAYHGKYFIKNHKIWIHNIKALKAKLKVISNDKLVSLGYDVENYHRYKKHTNKMVDNELINIYINITHADGEATYLYDGVWLLPDGTLEER